MSHSAAIVRITWWFRPNEAAQLGFLIRVGGQVATLLSGKVRLPVSCHPEKLRLLMKGRLLPRADVQRDSTQAPGTAVSTGGSASPLI